MLTSALQERLDVRKLATQEACFEGGSDLASLNRFKQALVNDSGKVDYRIKFYLNESYRPRVEGELKGNVQLACQRCMQPMPWQVNASFDVAIVLSEEQLKHVPKEEEAITAEDGEIVILELMEDELLLALPIVQYHPENGCNVQLEWGKNEVEPVVEKTAKDNPFKILETLK